MATITVTLARSRFGNTPKQRATLAALGLKKIRQANVNVRAATTFSTNDFIANAGVLVGGGLVLWTGRAWPDLVVGLAVAAIALKGGIEILQDARGEEDA